MDETVAEFLQAANAENQHRRSRRRYSAGLRQRALAYWQRRKGEDGMRTIAAALGVSATTLQRWTRASRPPRVRPIAVVPTTAHTEAAPIVVVITAAGPRVEGLTVESAARLLTLLV